MTRARDSVGRKLREHAADPAKYAGTAAVQTEDSKPRAKPKGDEQPGGEPGDNKEGDE